MIRAEEIAKAKGIKFDPSDWVQIWSILDSNKIETGNISYLYAIIDLKNRLVKFGKSVFPSGRLKSLKTGNGNKLVLAAFCSEAKLSEKQVHQKLSALRVDGEWFELNETTQFVIDDIRRFV